jgi:hypothetical protein
MRFKTNCLLATTALFGLMLQASTSFGGTVVRETTTTTPNGSSTTTTTQQSVTTSPVTTTTATTVTGTTSSETYWRTEEHSTGTNGARSINFIQFDMNNDKILSINEIGLMLFKLYDTDGNQVIDNIEYERRAVVTVLPMEKNTVVSYDFDGDGLADKTQYTQETFSRDTLLTRFDSNKDGLSAHEFMDMHFNEADVNNDKVVDEKEWRGSYIPRLDKLNKQKAQVNK